MEQVRSGPSELNLHNFVRFRRRTRRTHCSFDDFVQVLQQSQTIETVNVRVTFALGLSVSQWLQLLHAFGSMSCLRNLHFNSVRGLEAGQPGDDYSIPMSVLADLLQNSATLEDLDIGWRVKGYSDDLTVLANAFRHSQLCGIVWGGSLFIDGSLSLIDPVLRSIGECHVLKYAILYECDNTFSSEGVNSLITRSTSLETLFMHGRRWDVLADSLGAAGCLLRGLVLKSEQVDEAGLSRIAAAIEGNSSLVHLSLTARDVFTAANCAALALSFTANRALVDLSITDRRELVDSDDSFQNMILASKKTCQSFSRVLKVNFRLRLHLTVPSAYRDTDEFKEMELQMALNTIGRGRLLADNCTRTDWVDALLSAKGLDPPLVLDCLYSLLRMNPLICHREDN